MSRPKNIEIDWLKGVRVLLLANYIPGPLAAQLLKTLGAEVIKVEPFRGDLLRQYPPFFEAEGGEKRTSAYFRALNGGFRSLKLDLKKTEGAEVLRALLPQCDIILDGNRPGSLARKLGGKIPELHPGGVYIPLSAHGQIGPDRDQAGHDNNVLARAGLLSYSAKGPEGLPAPFGTQVADTLAAFTAALTAVAALYGRQNPRSGAEIKQVDASLLHAAFYLNHIHLASAQAEDRAPQSEGEWMNGGWPNYRSYATKDGQAVFLGPIEPNLFLRFLQAIDRVDLVNVTMQDRAEAIRQLEGEFAKRDLETWETLLREVDCCFSKVNSLDEALEDGQIQALGLNQEVEDPEFGGLRLTRFPAGFGPESLPPAVASRAAALGEDSAGILQELLGYDAEQISILREKKVI